MASGLTVGATLRGSVMALARQGGDAFLERNVSDDMIAAHAAGITIERGERFAISRGVAVVPVRGMLTPNGVLYERYFGWSTYQGIEETMSDLARDEEVSAIVLDVDCVGGMVLGLDAASDAINEAKAVKPVHALVNPVAASAAYWLVSQATDIAMTPGALAGCIGTRVASGAPVQPDQWGDQWFEISSSNARAKNPDPTTEAGMAEFKRSLDESEAAFHAIVAAGRGIDLAALPAILSVTDDVQDGGAMFGCDQAIARGLADTKETRAQFYDRIMTAYAPAPRKQGAGALALAHAAAARVAL
jgi:ClpP class serine protease